MDSWFSFDFFLNGGGGYCTMAVVGSFLHNHSILFVLKKCVLHFSVCLNTACCNCLGLNATEQLYLLNGCTQWNAQGHGSNLLRPKITLFYTFRVLPGLWPSFH